jgi:hypothetical protein
VQLVGNRHILLTMTSGRNPSNWTHTIRLLLAAVFWCYITGLTQHERTVLTAIPHFRNPSTGI